MPAIPTADPRPGCFLQPLGPMPRAGTPAQQIALQDRAWTMLELYETPSGRPGTRLSNAWLGAQGWRVQMVDHFSLWKEEFVAPLNAAARRRGHEFLLGTVVQPGVLRVSAVWHVATDPDPTSRFFEAHEAGFHMLFPEDLSFAIHANDGDYAVYAGPEEFIRAALPPEAIGAAATADVVEGIEEEHGEGAIDGILAHYAPFMLDR
ncbi:hypothetical protein SAMN02745775_11089 [Falsiroseomonas stagni DSM 19981]|uniref:Uncharacterized protein n=1 Tax=Falsiroseomonas stagni DSM 19981 TaxID=1123062 RepID=A0A1I4DAM7_9PROT|nr:hypothetical protein SAMN02745775_11089 [Falsiroseomonas stagni DSM 19981]